MNVIIHLENNTDEYFYSFHISIVGSAKTHVCISFRTSFFTSYDGEFREVLFHINRFGG